MAIADSRTDFKQARTMAVPMGEAYSFNYQDQNSDVVEVTYDSSYSPASEMTFPEDHEDIPSEVLTRWNLLVCHRLTALRIRPCKDYQASCFAHVCR